MRSTRRVITLRMGLLVIFIKPATVSVVGKCCELGRWMEEVDAQIHGFFTCDIVSSNTVPWMAKCRKSSNLGTEDFYDALPATAQPPIPNGSTHFLRIAYARPQR